MGLTATIVSFYYFLKISFQFIVIMVRAKYSFWKARRTFSRTLVLDGISRESAREIATAYPNPMDGLLGLIRAGMPVSISDNRRSPIVATRAA